MTVRHTLLYLSTAALLAACGSSKRVVEDVPALPQTKTEVVTPQIKGPEKFTADLDLSLGMGGDSYSLGGKVCMKREKVVRMNLTFMGFVEVGIIEFAPDYILIVNKMQKEYTKAPYNSLDVLRKNNINFAAIEKMAWEELYSQDGKAIKDNKLGKALEQMINSNVKGSGMVSVKIEVGKPNTTRDFETYTTPKDSYKEVPAQLLMARFMQIN